MSYTAPNPYVESVPFKGNAPTVNSNSIMGMIGITPTGDTTKACLVTSWSEFIEKYALGTESPFMRNSTLIHAVYGFFQNGGSQLYVARIVGPTAQAAYNMKSPGSEGSGAPMKFTAKNPGEWGNQIKCRVEEVAKAPSDSTSETKYNIEIYYKDKLVEKHSNLSANTMSPRYYQTYLETNSNYVISDGYTIFATEAMPLTEGADAIAGITDTQYINALKLFDSVHNLAGISVPGQTTNAIASALVEYTKDKPILPVFCHPESAPDFDTTGAFLSAYLSASGIEDSPSVIYAPYILIADPDYPSKVKTVSPEGHIMGVIARTIDTKGEWNAAAGTEAVIKGALGVAKEYSDEHRGILNSKGVNVIIPKPNYGIVCWGARSLSSDPELKYQPNLTLNHTVRREIKDAMQKFEFKNNNSSLWVDITAEITSILETKRLAGAFAGSTPETCYFVKCDASNNTQATIDKGQVIVEVGYAANKPAEFIIVRVAHQITV